MITPEQVKNDPAIRSYIQKADACLSALGYTAHSFAHVGRVASEAKRILLALGKGQRQAELAEIAGYLHDIGNIVNREEHAQSGAIMAFRLLDKMGMDPEESAEVNWSVRHSELTLEPECRAITLLLTIDTEICSVMEYFEIFIGRMALCRRAAQRLGLRFHIVINGQEIL